MIQKIAAIIMSFSLSTWAAEWMIDNGFGRGAYHVALLGGEIDTLTMEVMADFAQLRFVTENYTVGRSQKSTETPGDAANFPYLNDPFTPNSLASMDATGLAAYSAIVSSKGVGVFLGHSYGSGVNTFLDQVASDMKAGTIEVVTMDELAPLRSSIVSSTIIRNIQNIQTPITTSQQETPYRIPVNG